MNDVKLKGYIRNIQNSHMINGTQYQSADMIVQSKAGVQDTIRIVFKKCILIPCEEDIISLTGSVRSHTEQLENKNKVNIYVSTYFDKPEDQINNNEVILDGRICKIDQLRTTSTGKLNFHAILANNIYVPESNIKINNYIPLVFWGKLAQEASNLKVNDKILLNGQLHSRTYTKTLSDTEKEIRMAHEIVVLNYEIQF